MHFSQLFAFQSTHNDYLISNYVTYKNLIIKSCKLNRSEKKMAFKEYQINHNSNINKPIKKKQAPVHNIGYLYISCLFQYYIYSIKMINALNKYYQMNLLFVKYKSK